MQRARAHGQQGFTLIEILVVIGIVGVLASIVILAINPSRHLLAAYDAMRRYGAGELAHAMEQYNIKFGGYPQDALLPSNACDAVPVCADGVTTDPGCMNLDTELAPDFIAHVPRDSREPNPNYSGFKIYKNDRTIEVVPMHLGEMTPFSPISRGLITRWTFDEEMGPSVPDATGCGPSATIVDGARSTDVPTVTFTNLRSMGFDGIDDYVEAPEIFNGNGDFTVTLWFKTTMEDAQLIGHVENAAGTNNMNEFWHIHIADFGLSGSMRDTTLVPISGFTAYTSGAFGDNTWHFAAMKREGLTMSVYINGASTSVAATAGDVSSSNTSLRLSFKGMTPKFTGSMDDVRVYRRALSEDELDVMSAGEG